MFNLIIDLYKDLQELQSFNSLVADVVFTT